MPAVGLMTSASDRPLPLRMRQDLRAEQMRFGRAGYWTIKDPASLRYYQFRDHEYAILRMLDGRTSLNQIVSRFEQRHAPLKLDAGQLQAFLGMLHGAGLVIADAAGQGEVLLNQRRLLDKRRLLSAFTNLLAFRWRGFDPTRFLNWVYPYCRWIFSKAFLVCALLLVLWAGALVILNHDEFRRQLPGVTDFFRSENALWLALALCVAKVLHELGHGLACKHFGGECHEMGLMLLVFTPCLYCNVSDAWMLKSKWQRIAIGAAGMAVEVVLAAVCTLLWWGSEPGLLHAFALDIVFVCSVSTVLFNGNPLLRYDGYYILSDAAEVPNLHEQAGAALRDLLARLGLAVPARSGRLSIEGQRWWLASYALASATYRWLMLIGILWFLGTVLKPYRLQALGQALAAASLVSVFIVPVVGFAMFLRDGSGRDASAWRRVGMRLGLAAMILLAAGLASWPYRIKVPVVVEPQNAVRVYVNAAGTLLECVHEGQRVRKGQVLARLSNLEVEVELARLDGQRNVQRQHVRNLEQRRFDDSLAARELPSAQDALLDLEGRLAQRRADRKRLVLRAPVAGTVLPPPLHAPPALEGELESWSGTPLDPRNLGCYLATGTLLCQIGDPRQLQVTAVTDETQVAFVKTGRRVKVRLDQVPLDVLWGTVREVAQVDIELAPQELAKSGELPSRQDKSGLVRPLGTSYEVRLALDPNAHQVLSGMVGWAKIDGGNQSLARRAYRYLSRTFRFGL